MCPSCNDAVLWQDCFKLALFNGLYFKPCVFSVEALTRENNGSKARSPHRCLTAVCHSDFMLKMKVRGVIYFIQLFHWWSFLRLSARKGSRVWVAARLLQIMQCSQAEPGFVCAVGLPCCLWGECFYPEIQTDPPKRCKSKPRRVLTEWHTLELLVSLLDTNQSDLEHHIWKCKNRFTVKFFFKVMCRSWVLIG